MIIYYFFRFSVLENNNTASKSPAKQSPVRQQTQSPRKFSPVKTLAEESKEANKENGDNQISGVRSKLQRLGKLYSGKSFFYIYVCIVYLHIPISETGSCLYTYTFLMQRDTTI